MMNGIGSGVPMSGVYWGSSQGTTPATGSSATGGLGGSEDRFGYSNMFAQQDASGFGNMGAMSGNVNYGQLLVLLLNLLQRFLGGGGAMNTSQAPGGQSFAKNNVTAPASTGQTSAPQNNAGPTPDSLKDIEAKYGAMVDASLAKHPGTKLTRNQVFAHIMAESGGNASDTTGDGGTSIGLMQLNDALGLSREDRLDPAKSIDFAVNILDQYSNEYNGDVVKTAAAYMTGDDINGAFKDKAAGYGQDILNMMNGK